MAKVTNHHFLPLSVARINTVWPNFDTTLTSAPFCMRNSATLSWPDWGVTVCFQSFSCITVGYYTTSWLGALRSLYRVFGNSMLIFLERIPDLVRDDKWFYPKSWNRISTIFLPKEVVKNNGLRPEFFCCFFFSKFCQTVTYSKRGLQ